MTAKRESGRGLPTEAELAVLRVLWTRGPSTVRTVHEALADRGTRYTTTLKIMQVMTEKGLLRRDDSGRSHVYAAAIREAPTQRRLLRGLLDRAFAGSAAKLVMQALDSSDLTPSELDEIRRLLKEKEADHGRAR